MVVIGLALVGAFFLPGVPREYEKMLRDPAYRPLVRIAVPTAVGDSYKGRRIMGSVPQMFGFNDDGTSEEGYDATGKLLSGYEDPNVPPDRRDQSKKVAGEALELGDGGGRQAGRSL